MEVVALVALGRNAEEEAPHLAAHLGLTVYETTVMLRGQMPLILFRSEDRARTRDVLGMVRSRGHEAVVVDLGEVTPSENMFRPRSFRLSGEELIAEAHGMQQTLLLGDIIALVRAVHTTHGEEVVTIATQQRSLGRTALTGGLVTTKTTSREASRSEVTREPVVYVFRGSGPPWLLASQELRYDGLGPDMKVSKTENFEVLLRVVRERIPMVTYDTRLLHVRPAQTIVNPGSKKLTTSTTGPLDILAHIVATAVQANMRAYR